jgi:hypothetical protein
LGAFVFGPLLHTTLLSTNNPAGIATTVEAQICEATLLQEERIYKTPARLFGEIGVRERPHDQIISSGPRTAS